MLLWPHLIFKTWSNCQQTFTTSTLHSHPRHWDTQKNQLYLIFERTYKDTCMVASRGVRRATEAECHWAALMKRRAICSAREFLEQQWRGWGSKRPTSTGRPVAHSLINLLSVLPAIPFILSHAQRSMSSICQPTVPFPTHLIMQFVLAWQLRMRPWRG